MLNRNPKLQLAFSGARLAEGRGLGMKTFNEVAAKHGLPRPKYEFDGVYLNLTIYRNAEAVLSGLDAATLSQLSKSEMQSWVLLGKKGGGKTGLLAKTMGIDERTARRHLNKFLALGLVEKIGLGPATKYTIK